MQNILIDTDVILDFLFDRKPYSDSAALLLSLCEKKTLNGFVTVVTISNAYYILRKNSRHEKVIESLKLLLKIVEIAPTLKDTVLTALESNFKDFEDALQNYSAEANKKISVIISRNTRDYKTSNLAIMTPENFLRIPGK